MKKLTLIFTLTIIIALIAAQNQVYADQASGKPSWELKQSLLISAHILEFY